MTPGSQWSPLRVPLSSLSQGWVGSISLHNAWLRVALHPWWFSPIFAFTYYINTVYYFPKIFSRHIWFGDLLGQCFSKSGPAAATSPGNLLEMQILRSPQTQWSRKSAICGLKNPKVLLMSAHSSLRITISRCQFQKIILSTCEMPTVHGALTYLNSFDSHKTLLSSRNIIWTMYVI